MATAARAIQDLQWTSVTEGSRLSEWHRRVLAMILRLARLQQSWDTYGSPKLQYAAQMVASDVVALLAPAEPPMPHVAPVPGGGLLFEWEFRNRLLEIEVLPDGAVAYLAMFEDGSTLEGPLPQYHTQAPNLVRWLKSSDAAISR